MPEIYVLKLCVVSFEGTSLPCGECSDFQNARAILSEASPVGAESPQEGDLSNRGPIFFWSNMGKHSQNSAPSEFPHHICSPNLTEIISPLFPSSPPNKKKREWEKGEQ